MRAWLAALAVLALASPAGAAQDGGRGLRSRAPANPTAVIASEIALNRLAREEGEWKALLEMAAPDAELFVPERVAAQDWLKGRGERGVVTRRDPYAAWMSCDASRGAVYGGWSQDGSHGRFVSFWLRDEKGGYKWLRRYAFPGTDPAGAPDMLSARVADCSKVDTGAAKTSPVSDEEELRELESDDNSLKWTWISGAEGKPQVIIRMWEGKEFVTVFTTDEGFVE